jgi:hypothetical protein
MNTPGKIADTPSAQVKELQTFVVDLTDWLASPPSPEKTATYYQIKDRAQRLRTAIDAQSLVMF